MMVDTGHGHELGLGHDLEHAVGHLLRHDRRQLAADEEGRRLDPVEELPAVDRVSGAVTLRVEAIREAPLALRDALPSKVVEQLWSGQRLRREQLEAPERLVQRLVATRAAVTPPMHGLQAPLWQ